MFSKKKEHEKPKTETNVEHRTPNVEHSTEENAEHRTQNTEQGMQNKESRKQTEELQKQIESLKKEKDDIFAKLQRVAADYDNYQKRSARQLADSINYEKDKIIKAILPVLDNFEYILTNTSCGVQDEALLKGVKIVYDQFLGVLKNQGVAQIQSAGEKFDPAQHEAITHRAEEGKDDSVVLEELQKGYISNGRVIRASRVVVNKLAAKNAEQAPTAEPQQQQEPQEDETKDTQ
jgi:molecular chaperone GrpE